jgi:hypothetical protein
LALFAASKIKYGSSKLFPTLSDPSTNTVPTYRRVSMYPTDKYQAIFIQVLSVVPGAVEQYTHIQYINIVVKPGKESDTNTLKRRRFFLKQNKFQMICFLTDGVGGSGLI